MTIPAPGPDRAGGPSHAAPVPPASRRLARSAGVIGIATMTSRVLGLVRDQVMAYLFGAGNAVDAYNVAFRVPNLVRDLFAEGAMSAAFVPTFTHELTHNGKAADKEAMYLKTNQYHIAQFAYLTQRMKDIKEGEGTLLDNSMLVCTSSLFDGDAHSANQLPFLITGKGGGTLRPGRVLDYLEKGDDNRRACSLHLSLMDRMGVKLDKFGDTSTRLAEI